MNREEKAINADVAAICKAVDSLEVMFMASDKYLTGLQIRALLAAQQKLCRMVSDSTQA